MTSSDRPSTPDAPPDAPPDAQDAARWEAVEEATELLLDGAVDEALATLRAALDRDPGNAYAHYYRGRCLLEKGDAEGARTAFTEAERRAPGYLGATVALGHALWRLGRHDEAARTGERALATRAEDPDALALLGRVHAERGDRARAIAYLERYLATRPEVEDRHDAEALLAALKGKARPIDLA